MYCPCIARVLHVYRTCIAHALHVYCTCIVTPIRWPQEILRLEKSLVDTQEKLGDSENARERLEKELESMGDLSSRVSTYPPLGQVRVWLRAGSVLGLVPGEGWVDLPFVCTYLCLFVLACACLYLFLLVCTWYMVLCSRFLLLCTFFTCFYLFVLVFTCLYWFLLVCTGFYLFVWFLLVCTGFYLFVLVFTCLYWFLLVCTGFYLFVLVFCSWLKWKNNNCWSSSRAGTQPKPWGNWRKSTG